MMLERLAPYRREIIMVSVSAVMLIVGLILSGAVVTGLLFFLFSGKSFVEWKWDYDSILKYFIGAFLLIVGIIGIMAALIKKPRALKISLASFLAVVFVLCGIISYRLAIDRAGSQGARKPAEIKPGEEIYVDIPMNSTATDIAEILKEKGLIKSTFIFRVLTRLNGYGAKYQSGTHILAKGLGYEEIMDILVMPPESVKVTIPEGYTYKQVVELLKQKMGINGDEFERVAIKLAPSYRFLQGLEQKPGMLEGYLFPDTYYFGLKDNEEQILKTILDNFDRKFKPEYYSRAEELGMTVHEIVTLASIVEKEAQAANERKTIAGVFYNRLRGRYGAPRRLESCATIQYVFLNRLENVPEETRNRIQKGIIYVEDTKVDDEYNTYKYEKLPPGPISNPGLACLEAALYPEDTKYIYFVARGDGTNDFSLTNEEHVSKMRKYGLLY